MSSGVGPDEDVQKRLYALIVLMLAAADDRLSKSEFTCVHWAGEVGTFYDIGTEIGLIIE